MKAALVVRDEPRAGIEVGVSTFENVVGSFCSLSA